MNEETSMAQKLFASKGLRPEERANGYENVVRSITWEASVDACNRFNVELKAYNAHGRVLSSQVFGVDRIGDAYTEVAARLRAFQLTQSIHSITVKRINR